MVRYIRSKAVNCRSIYLTILEKSQFSYQCSTCCSFSTLSTFSPLIERINCKRKEEEEKKYRHCLWQQSKREYTPLIPVLAVAVVGGVAWVAYRKSQGKPVAPDEALAAQEAYKKHQERLIKQQQQRENRQGEK